MNKKISYNNLTNCFKTKSKLVSFSNFNRPLGLKNKIISTWFYRPRQIKKYQKQFGSSRNKAKRERWEHKSEEQKSITKMLKCFTKIRKKL